MSLLLTFYYRNTKLAPRNMAFTIVKCFAAAIIMALLLFAADRLFPAQGGKILQLGIICLKAVAAVVIYFGIALLLKMKEATYWISRFRSRLAGKSAGKS